MAALRIEAVYELAARAATSIPDELRLEPGARTTLRDALGLSLQLLNKASGWSFLTAFANLPGSTSVSMIAAGVGRPLERRHKPPRAVAVDRRHL